MLLLLLSCRILENIYTVKIRGLVTYLKPPHIFVCLYDLFSIILFLCSVVNRFIRINSLKRLYSPPLVLELYLIEILRSRGIYPVYKIDPRLTSPLILSLTIAYHCPAVQPVRTGFILNTVSAYVLYLWCIYFEYLHYIRRHESISDERF